MTVHSVPRTDKPAAERHPITQERLKQVLHYDPGTGIFTWKVPSGRRVKAGQVAGSPTYKGYVRIMVDNCSKRAHNLAWLYVYGEWPKDQLDHINRVKTDNRIANLRESSPLLNQRNLSKACNNTSGVTGVTWSRKESKWVAQIVDNHKATRLGAFEDFNEAVSARKAAELRLWGSYLDN